MQLKHPSLPLRTPSPPRATKRLFLLDHDGTLVPQSSILSKPKEPVLRVLRALCADPRNTVYIVSGRARTELADWFAPVVSRLETPGA